MDSLEETVRALGPKIAQIVKAVRVIHKNLRDIQDSLADIGGVEGVCKLANQIGYLEQQQRESVASVVNGKSLLDVPAIAKLLGVSVATIRSHMSMQNIPHYKIGRRILFDADEVIRWRERRHVYPRGQR